MKKYLLLLLVSGVAFSQASVEIRLVNSNVGAPIYDWSLGFPVSTNNSNDAALNAIFATYGVTNYADNIPHPYPPYVQKVKIIFGTFPQQFLTDLSAYSSVIESVKITTQNQFSDALRLQLLNSTTGSPNGSSNNVIVTNDIGLNSIFQNFNVFYYVQSYPSAPAGNALLRFYDVVCDCDKNLLNTALLNYTSVIQTTDQINGGIMLANPNFTTSAAILYPNPFTNNFTIETQEAISNYSLFDISGKQILSTTSKNELDTKSQEITTGFYVLNLTFDNGQTANYKLIKK